jgi:transaldolase
MGIHGSVAAAGERHPRHDRCGAANSPQANRPNLYVKIPGTPEGVPAIEAAIFAGVPVNVTLLFSREQYLAVAEAYMRGIERRIAAGLDPRINSVASVFVSRWDRSRRRQGAGKDLATASVLPSCSARIARIAN